MMIFVGTKPYGKVDRVPGLFFVVTRFFHIQFVPLIPVGSYLILDVPGSDSETGGVRIGLSGKSILFAWLRLLLILGGGALAFLGMTAVFTPRKGQLAHWDTSVLFLAASGVCFLLLWASYRLSRPRVIRALRLAGQAGIGPEVVAQFFAASLSEAQLEQLAQQARGAEERLFDAPTSSGAQE